MTKKNLLLIAFGGICFFATETMAANDNEQGNVISSSFELRAYDPDPGADGQTDFKGETAVFDTEQRIDFLGQYAQYAQSYFSLSELDKKPVLDDEVESVLGRLKPQPQPQIRKRISLNDCKWLGYKQDQHAESLAKIENWNQVEGLAVRDGKLLITGGRLNFVKKMPAQTWRFLIQWQMKVDGQTHRRSFQLLSDDTPVITVGFDETGRFFYHTAEGDITGPVYSSNQWYDFKIEVDLTCMRYNFYVDEKLVADFVRYGQASSVNGIGIEAEAGAAMDNLWAVQYQKLTGSPMYPYSIHTIIDENFDSKPDIQGWQGPDYDDTCWQQDELPIVHGGERYAGEDLYIRKKVSVPDFEKAYLSIETIDPEGEIWINGQVALVSTNRHPICLDIGTYLKANQENLIAIKVRHFDFDRHDIIESPHTTTDTNFGWFSGRGHLDIVPRAYIEDVFVYTRSVCDPADMAVRVKIKNEGWGPLGDDVNQRRGAFDGSMEIRFHKWHPLSESRACASLSVPVRVRPWDSRQFDTCVNIAAPELWTFQSPNLYKVEVILKDQSGKSIDDYVVTTGIRTASQAGGIFRINDQPEVINGAQLMGFRSPLDKIATWSRCAPINWIIKEILMNKKMNGNGLKMQIHQWQEPARNINDPRFAEVADQLGFMYIWATTAWDRTGSQWGVDFDGYTRYMKQVYNHPSIVMWLASGHPRFEGIQEANQFYDTICSAILSVDPSRLISPNEFNFFTGYGNDKGTVDTAGNAIVASKYWTDPHVVRANQDAPTGYGAEWSVLRKWPDEYTAGLLESPTHAYFNIEHEETTGQPNWDLLKGKPSYLVASYEQEYNIGSIGSILTFDQWRQSQAWQAFAAYEATKKERLLDYDGFSWCCLHGGGNTATYQKPLIDYYDHAKLAYYTYKLVHQRILAGSDNVDVVYGPGDFICPVILNIGTEKNVNLEILIRDMQKNIVYRKVYENIHVSAGRSVARLEKFQPVFPVPGIYAVEYKVLNP